MARMGMKKQFATLQLFLLVSALLHAGAFYLLNRYSPLPGAIPPEETAPPVKVELVTGEDWPVYHRPAGDRNLDESRAEKEPEIPEALKPTDPAETLANPITLRVKPISAENKARILQESAPETDGEGHRESHSSIIAALDIAPQIVAEYSSNLFRRVLLPETPTPFLEKLSREEVNSLTRMEFPGEAQAEKPRIKVSKTPRSAGREGGAGRDYPQSEDEEAQLLDIKKPAYPYYDRRKGNEGQVVLDAYVLEDGSVGAVEVLKSSSYSRLDRAAMEALSKAKFRPARRNNTPVPSHVKISFKFVLKDE